jgi:hypothetical protein
MFSSIRRQSGVFLSWDGNFEESQTMPPWHLETRDMQTMSSLFVQYTLIRLSSSDPSGQQMMGDICRQFNGRGLG